MSSVKCCSEKFQIKEEVVNSVGTTLKCLFQHGKQMSKVKSVP